MGTCKLWAGDRRESVIGYRSMGAKASSSGDGLSNYPAGCPGCGGGSRRTAGVDRHRDRDPLPARGRVAQGRFHLGPGDVVVRAGRSRRIARWGLFYLRDSKGAASPSPPASPPSRRTAVRSPTPPQLSGLGGCSPATGTCSPRQRRTEKLERVPTIRL